MNYINILLDLDNTLISSIATHEETPLDSKKWDKFRWEDMEGAYKVFERPGLQNFLDYLFKNFKVSVWTAASKSYALFIIDEFILKNHPERRLEYIFFSHHCKKSQKFKKTQKSLSLLSEKFNLPEFTIKSTYIIDDHPEVYSAQPMNCIQIKPFEFSDDASENDVELKKIISVLKQL